MTLTIETLRAVLGWATLINYALLVWWFLMFLFAHAWMYRLHNEWFDLPVQTFNTVHYLGMAFFKMGIFLFFLVPWLALLIATRGSG